MKVLAIDTSAKVSSVAVVDENGTIATFTINTALTHSQTLMPMISAVLKSSAIKLSNIDLFACSSGPGSFTGLRIGIAAIKGLAYGSAKPCVGVSTIEALAYNFLGIDSLICVAMDARCNQVYHGMFEVIEGKITRLSEDMAITVDDLYIMLKKYDKPIFLVGDGADLCYNKLGEKLSNLFLANDLLKRQNAQSVGALALQKANIGQTQKATKLMPTYLRLPQAQRELLKKRKELSDL